MTIISEFTKSAQEKYHPDFYIFMERIIKLGQKTIGVTMARFLTDPVFVMHFNDQIDTLLYKYLRENLDNQLLIRLLVPKQKAKLDQLHQFIVSAMFDSNTSLTAPQIKCFFEQLLQ